MATNSSEFVPPILGGMHAIRDLIGTDIMMVSSELYDITVLNITLHAMTLKILQDLHPDVVTDAALSDRLSASIAGFWPGWVLLQVRPSDLAMYGATDTDSAEVLKAKIDAYNAANQ